MRLLGFALGVVVGALSGAIESRRDLARARAEIATLKAERDTARAELAGVQRVAGVIVRDRRARAWGAN